jgi:hypothetical protein
MTDKWGPSINAARPTFAVDGTANIQLATDLQSLVILETQGSINCDVTFNNWGQSSNGVGYLYTDNPQFEPGKQFQVKLGNTSMFSGVISGISTIQTQHGASSICITSEFLLRSTGTRLRVPKSWEITYGQSLRDITIGHFLGKKSGQAIAGVNVSLHIGDTVNIKGVGARFNGNYSVSEVKHLFDMQLGLRTEFKFR